MAMAKLDWERLGFEYSPVRANVRHTWKDGAWGEARLCSEATISLGIAATCLHYGQACFEGLKAFMAKDGRVRIFRPEANARRMASSADFLLAPELPEPMFIAAVEQVVRQNLDYIPPYGTGGSFYIRPLLIGSGATIGVKPSPEYEFIVMGMPVGAYYKGGLTPVDALVVDDFDRAAPQGTGCYKVAGNYAASLKPGHLARQRGFPISLFLDARTRTLVEEFSTSNFIGITRDGRYVTPESRSILPSVTNDSLMQLARDEGIAVERRPVPADELADFAEVGACGTAVVITAVGRIVHGERTYTYPPLREDSVLSRLYRHMTGIQYGDRPDIHGWMREVMP
jgi:branched-chain amino acid aminotransferase